MQLLQLAGDRGGLSAMGHIAVLFQVIYSLKQVEAANKSAYQFS